MKKLVALTLVVISLFALCSCTKTEKTPNMSCSIEVDCTQAIESGKLSDAKRMTLPANGKVIAKRDVLFAKGESVFDVLVRELQNDKIQVHIINGDTKNNKYIKAISNLYQLEENDYSGWSYYVNGELPMVSAAEYELSEGDEILFKFIEDFTKEQ